MNPNSGDLSFYDVFRTIITHRLVWCLGLPVNLAIQDSVSAIFIGGTPLPLRLR